MLDGLLADPRLGNFYRSRMVTHGTPTARGYLRELSRFSLVGLAGQIDCPTLALEAEDDPTSDGQLDVFAGELTAPVTTHRFSRGRGRRRALRGTGPASPGAGRLRLD